MEKNQAAGYDEDVSKYCECHYEDFPWKRVELPDHGEVWSLAARSKQRKTPLP